jgi:hypothetical protein
MDEEARRGVCVTSRGKVKFAFPRFPLHFRSAAGKAVGAHECRVLILGNLSRSSRCCCRCLPPFFSPKLLLAISRLHPACDGCSGAWAVLALSRLRLQLQFAVRLPIKSSASRKPSIRSSPPFHTGRQGPAFSGGLLWLRAEAVDVSRVLHAAYGAGMCAPSCLHLPAVRAWARQRPPW